LAARWTEVQKRQDIISERKEKKKGKVPQRGEERKTVDQKKRVEKRGKSSSEGGGGEGEK